MRKTIKDKSTSLSAVLEEVNKFEKSFNLKSSIPARIVILRNITIENIEPFLKYHCYSSDIKPEIAFGGYDNVQQDILSGNMIKQQTDVVVLAHCLSQFEPDYELNEWSSDELYGRLRSIYENLRSKTKALVLINTFFRPIHDSFGVTANANPDSLTAKINDLNQKIIFYAKENSSQFIVIDWEKILMNLGANESFDTRFKYLSKAPFKTNFLNLYALEIAKVIRALKGKSKKCLVLDCDNTLWGGIVGEDGLDGIKLDKHDYPGKVYYDFQKNVLQLIKRGVLVVICSKNNESDVFEALEKHPECLLKKKHLAAWRINWLDKVKNIISLADELNLGLDSFVYIDDSDVEINRVNEALPEVEVKKVPQDIFEFPDLILKEGLFDVLRISKEDLKRTELYQQEAKRKAAVKEYCSLEDYLASLKIKICVSIDAKKDIERVAQLTQKTNQFNLTTRRYSETDIENLVKSKDSIVFALTVSDKFGDLGLTGVCIVKRNENKAIVDTLLLSCRVLGRNVEKAFVNCCLAYINKKWKPKTFLAEYIETKKNIQVESFWLGFNFKEVESGKGKKYTASPKELSIKPIKYISVNCKE